MDSKDAAQPEYIKAVDPKTSELPDKGLFEWRPNRNFWTPSISAAGLYFYNIQGAEVTDNAVVDFAQLPFDDQEGFRNQIRASDWRPALNECPVTGEQIQQPIARDTLSLKCDMHTILKNQYEYFYEPIDESSSGPSGLTPDTQHCI